MANSNGQAIDITQRQTLTINGKNAFNEWGVSLDEEALSLLMTPAPLKPLIQNKSRLADGKEVIVPSNASELKLDERQMTIVFNLYADTPAAFLTRYGGFVQELQKGKVEIATSYLPGVVFRCIYVSCTQFVEFEMGIGKFYVRFEEPNPADRTPSA